MWLNGIRHIVRRLGFTHAPRAQETPSPVLWESEIDTAWYGHGDHWHNLLASPLDARHYVMEDWEPSSYTPTHTSRAG